MAFWILNNFKNFEDSASESWTESEELNPLTVNRLGYRDNNSIILDFIRAGTQLVESREGYTNDEEFDNVSENYFEDIGFSLDNLHDSRSRVEDKLQEQEEFSTSSSEVVVNSANEKPEFSTSSDQEVVVNSDSDN